MSSWTQVTNESRGPRVTRTGRTSEGRRVREERWPDGSTTVWNCWEGRPCTEDETNDVTWRD